MGILLRVPKAQQLDPVAPGALGGQQRLVGAREQVFEGIRGGFQAGDADADRALNGLGIFTEGQARYILLDSLRNHEGFVKR